MSGSATSDKLQQALALHRQGKLAQAEPLYRAVIAEAPHTVEALHFLGVIASKRGRFDEAERLIDRALALRPDNAAALYDRGNALRDQRRPDEALASYDRAIALRPDYAEALTNRGNVLMGLKRPADALASYDRALAIEPERAKVHYNRGNALRDLKRLEEALASYDRALALRPDYASAWFGRGNVLRELRRLDDALASYDKALALEPDHAKMHWNESLCRLLAGDFVRGWPKYEWRWHTEALRKLKRPFPEPLWLGREDLSGKTVLLHAEQGYGDTVQFCRYVPMVAARGARVVLEVQRRLKALLAGLEGAEQVIARGESLPAFDVHCPLLSLPLAFGTTLATIPARVPYLNAAPDLTALWRARLGEGDAPRIGLAWSGNPTHHNDQNRSIALAELAPLLDLDATLVSLQKDLREEDHAWLAAHPRIVRFAGELRDFDDTAALIESLDIVVTADTAVAHLAGAMGKPVWILLPFIGVDWRWGLNRADTPWYPTARLFRQPRIDDWASVIAAMARELSGFAIPA